MQLFNPDQPPLPTATCPMCHGLGHITLTVEWTTGARTTDPETSHQAAEANRESNRFSVKSRQARALRIIWGTPLTAQEVAYAIVGEHAPASAVIGAARTVYGLARFGFVTDSGVRRSNPGSRSEAVVYEVTDLGRWALNNLRETGWSM